MLGTVTNPGVQLVVTKQLPEARLMGPRCKNTLPGNQLAPIYRRG